VLPALAVSKGNRMKALFTDRSDYRIETHGPSCTVFCRYPHGWERVGAFTYFSDADDFVRRRTEPKEFPSPVFDDICRCGYTPKGWDYVTTDEYTYELCNSCKNPLRHYILAKVVQSYKDFDFDAWLDS
jgi:hypothetical protein